MNIRPVALQDKNQAAVITVETFLITEILTQKRMIFEMRVHQPAALQAYLPKLTDIMSNVVNSTF